MVGTASGSLTRRRLPAGHPATTSNFQLPTFEPANYQVTWCLPVTEVAIVTALVRPLGAS